MASAAFRFVAVLGILALAAAIGGAAGVGSLLVFAPALVLFGALVAGRYVGEDVLDRLRTRRIVPTRRPVVSASPLGRRLDVAYPAGIARCFALASRPPPFPC